MFSNMAHFLLVYILTIAKLHYHESNHKNISKIKYGVTVWRDISCHAFSIFE